MADQEEVRAPAPAPADTGARGSGSAGASARGSLWRYRPLRVTAIALLLGLAVTAAFALISSALYNQNEDRLLRLRAHEVGSVLTAAVPTLQTPLASGAELADATGGS